MPDWLDQKQWARFLDLTARIPPQGAVGHALTSMYGFQGRTVPDDLTPDRLDRQMVLEFCANHLDGGRDVDCFLAIAAWGWMRRPYAQMALQAWPNWSDALHDVRRAETRADAYQAMFAKRQRDANGHRPLVGVGPAYYTKLITFLASPLRPYIMDQWTGKAVEVLSNDQFELQWSKNTVSDSNGPDAYEEFCGRMDALACLEQGVDDPAALTFEQASAFEARLFSSGAARNRPAARWRQAVQTAWAQRRN